MSEKRPIHITLDLWADDKPSALEALEYLCKHYRDGVHATPIECSGMSSGYDNFGFSMWQQIDARYIRQLAARPAPQPDDEGVHGE